jgi:aryl-phospho-beta-D-glucosidase BglC (GH1 family)
MQIKRFLTLLFFILFFLPAHHHLPVNSFSPHPPRQDGPMRTAAEINRSLGRGINLGNALEAPKGISWGVYLQEEYFTLIKEKGFSSVRIPIRWSDYALPKAPYTIEEKFFAKVDWAIGEALKNGLHVIINFHHYEELFRDPHREWGRFLDMWAQVAKRYKDYPDALVFEILNEPHDRLTAELWNKLLAEVLAVIRKTNPGRAVMVGTAEWGGAGSVMKLVLPADDRLILTVHYYNPFQFTHQGAEWSAGSRAWLGTTWDGSYVGKQMIRNELEPVLWYSREHNIPVNIGEFGAYSKADMASRARWTAYCARLFEELGFSWHYWEFCSGFGIYDARKKVFHMDLVNALISDDKSILDPGGLPPVTGVEMVTNGDFSAGSIGWHYGVWVSSPYRADFRGVNQEFVVDVQTAGDEEWPVQLIRDGISLQAGRCYLLSFEAWSDRPRSFSAEIGAVVGSDYPIYGSASVFVTPERRKYYVLGTAGKTLSTGRVVFSFGKETGCVYLDNVSLKEVAD